MYYLYFIGVVMASLLVTMLTPEALNNAEMEAEANGINADILKVVMLCILSFYILLSWYTVGSYGLKIMRGK
jgi:ABC-type Mn2+/Zn2+ transport system permease subunit